jgi:phytoene dehydrogenase-like protein
MRAVVIGTGVSGLTAALYLLRDGCEVQLFEQHDEAGGVTGALRSDGYTWDLGQLLLEGFGPGEQVGSILAELGLADGVDLIRDDRIYAFPDFRIEKPDEPAGLFWRRERLKELFPEERAGLDRYYRFYIPSLHSPEMAPPGHHAVTLYTVAPNHIAGDRDAWSARREEFADKLVAEAERFIPGLRAGTRKRVILTPEEFRRRTFLAHHAFGGVAPVMGGSGVPHATPLAGLWFIGAQSESGAGMNNVMHGAWKTWRAIRSA